MLIIFKLKVQINTFHEICKVKSNVIISLKNTNSLKILPNFFQLQSKLDTDIKSNSGPGKMKRRFVVSFDGTVHRYHVHYVNFRFYDCDVNTF